MCVFVAIIGVTLSNISPAAPVVIIIGVVVIAPALQRRGGGAVFSPQHGTDFVARARRANR